jgi:hypothetical protein
MCSVRGSIVSTRDGGIEDQPRKRLTEVFGTFENARVLTVVVRRCVREGRSLERCVRIELMDHVIHADGDHLGNCTLIA